VGSSLVSGEIQFATRPQLPVGAKAHVRLLDTTMSDAPALLIAELVLPGISEKANAGSNIPFELAARSIDERRNYSIAVLVDLDGDEKTSRGDFVTTQSYPVLTFGYPAHVRVMVNEVT
jgi:uncharacterized lipoprotein YbaY